MTAGEKSFKHRTWTRKSWDFCPRHQNHRGRRHDLFVDPEKQHHDHECDRVFPGSDQRAYNPTQEAGGNQDDAFLATKPREFRVSACSAFPIHK